MYRLIIVDDESAIRKGMCKYIPWNDMGFELVGDFEDGKEAMEYINNHSVDVVLTDIQMAEVSGLELSQYIDAHKLPIKVVILSGYKRFEYAQQAVEFKVESYLMKPLVMDRVQAVFSKIRQDLDDLKAEKEVKAKTEATLNLSMNVLKEQFLMSILVGTIRTKSAMIEYSQFLRIDLPHDLPYAVMDLTMHQKDLDSISFYDHQGNKQKLLHDLFGHQLDWVSYYVADLAFDVSKIIAVANDPMAPSAFLDILKNQLEDQCLIAKQLFQLDISIRVEHIYEDVFGLLEYQYQPSISPGNFVSKKELPVESYDVILKAHKKLAKVIHHGKFDVATHDMQQVFFDLRQVPLNHVQQLMVDVFAMFCSKLMRMGNDLWVTVLNQINYQTIMTATDMKDLKRICLDYMGFIVNVVDSNRSDVTERVMREAMHYMESNYDKDISLEHIADRYYLNPTYFSRVFKQCAGMTFTEYLMDRRIKAAMDYVKTGQYKMYEISKMVGYQSEKYFYKVFKQYTGYTPAEYSRCQVIADE